MEQRPSTSHDTQAKVPADEARSTVRLDHASVMTTQFGPAVDFYTDLLGLRLRVIEDDPIRAGRRRAMLVDGEEHDVVELIEMPEMAHPAIPGHGAIHHLGFRLSQRAWHALRARLDAAGYPYQEIEGRLFVRDADGLVLEVEHG